MRKFIFTAAILTGVAFSGAAYAECAVYPTSYYLGKLSHEQVASYVDRKYGGDWSGYLGMLQRNLGQLKDIKARGKAVALKRNGKKVTVGGARLARYIDVSNQRLSVSRCLAAAASTDDQGAAAFNNFATAAGGNDVAETPKAPRRRTAVAQTLANRTVTNRTVTNRTATNSTVTPKKPATEVAQASQRVRVWLENEVAAVAGTPLGVEIMASCTDGETRFKVTNNGRTWPKQGKFALYRLDGDKRQMVSARRMRLTRGQSATFRVKAKHNPTGDIGLFVSPLWYERPFNLDSRLSCRK